MRSLNNFEWTDEAQRAFEELKTYLTTPPLLTSPKQGEPLLLYLAATPVVGSAALVKEEDGSQRPVYYVSEALGGAKGRYTQIEKIAYALLMASRKLRHYFMGHTIMLKKNVDPKLQRKLNPKWEGPYRITAVLGNVAYHLENMKGQNLVHAWNGDKLRRFYT